MRIADHAALAAAERDVHHGALPGHPGGQRAHRVDGLLGVEADAALGRAAGVVVLDSEAAEDLDPAVVHSDRDREVVLTLWPAQELSQTLLELQSVGDRVELPLGHLECVELFAHEEPPGSHAGGVIRLFAGRVNQCGALKP